MRTLSFLVMFCLFAACVCSVARGEGQIVSHPNVRPLPAGHDRPLPAGELIYVDVTKGSDAGPGTLEKPLRSVQAAVDRAQAGQTVVLRAGTYYESVKVSKAGTVAKPITIRAYPREVAIIDAGFPEFYNDPKGSWEPAPGGAPGEYRSTKTYEMEPWTIGANFGDSMLPLIVYRFAKDMRETEQYWALDDKSQDERTVYCGPGVFYDAESKRIHIRLAPTTMKMLGKNNYNGVTDPRQVPLVLGGRTKEPALTITSSAHVNVQDVVLRGGGTNAAAIDSSYDVELSGCTLYAGNSALSISFTKKVRLLNTAFRGACSPWNFRGQMKYRSREAKVIHASGWNTGGVEDLEIGYCEMTDSIDGMFIGGVKRVQFHNNLVDNFTDDGIFVSANTTPDGTTQGGGLELYENMISRTLTAFAFGVGHGRQLTLDEEKKIKQLGMGLFVYRNVFDFRSPVHYSMPKDAAQDGTLDEHGRLMGDHGSPTWEPIAFYQNTVVFGEGDGRGLYPFSVALGGGTKRRVFNNALLYAKGLPGPAVLKPHGDLQTDANLVWSWDPAWTGQEPYPRFQAKGSKDFELSKDYYPPGWMVNDVVKDPKVAKFSPVPGSALDLTPGAGSPALGAGLKLPDGLPDPMKPEGDKRPDIGAIQSGKPVWRLGVQGRFNAFGVEDKAPAMAWNTGRAQGVAKDVEWSAVLNKKPIGIVQGYPPIDRPQLMHFLKSNHVQIGFNERAWPKAEELKEFGVLAVVDSARGMYAPSELAGPLKEYVDKGGTLLVLSGSTESFRQMPGFLTSIVGEKPAEKKPEMDIMMPGHPWIKQLEAMEPKQWMPEANFRALPVSKGQVIIGNKNGQALMAVVPSGKGQLIYVGWSVTADRPQAGSRSEWANTPQAEMESQAQVDILKHIVNTLYPDPVELEGATPAPVMGRLTGE